MKLHWLFIFVVLSKEENMICHRSTVSIISNKAGYFKGHDSTKATSTLFWQPHIKISLDIKAVKNGSYKIFWKVEGGAVPLKVWNISGITRHKTPNIRIIMGKNLFCQVKPQFQFVASVNVLNVFNISTVLEFKINTFFFKQNRTPWSPGSFWMLNLEKRVWLTSSNM